MSTYLTTLTETVDTALRLPKLTWAKITLAATSGWVVAAAFMTVAVAAFGTTWPGVGASIGVAIVVYWCAAAWVAAWSTVLAAHTQESLGRAARQAWARYAKVLWAETAVAAPIVAMLLPALILAGVAAVTYPGWESVAATLAAVAAAATGLVGCVWWWARNCVAVQVAVLAPLPALRGSARYTRGRKKSVAGVAATVNVAVSSTFGVVFLSCLLVGAVLAAAGWVWVGAAVALLGRVTFSVVNAAVYHTALTCMYTQKLPEQSTQSFTAQLR